MITWERYALVMNVCYMDDNVGIHDEYWHPHADMNNTGHYHYSGLLYMSTYRKDFDGGMPTFTDEGNIPHMLDLF